MADTINLNVIYITIRTKIMPYFLVLSSKLHGWATSMEKPHYISHRNISNVQSYVKFLEIPNCSLVDQHFSNKYNSGVSMKLCKSILCLMKFHIQR